MNVIIRTSVAARTHGTTKTQTSAAAAAAAFAGVKVKITLATAAAAGQRNFLQTSKAKTLTFMILELKIVLALLLLLLLMLLQLLFLLLLFLLLLFPLLGLYQRTSSLNLQASKLSFLDKTLNMNKLQHASGARISALQWQQQLQSVRSTQVAILTSQIL